ncbi:hypothetical protein SISSUDRAFT_1053861 [Sistotremastrum suecicum HHB10207 ss-3]|uniref:Uncharacterized protein n=1 Tax=Sistotremastrum suecicum HHB10207 ss-3 TaxID=1314776 RepID=A0A165YYG5_9AGAM|nr:hypothetical protein SISSUDRAFT_1053861 [Sistotremastrum suecicum HHB10207 ss-3]
MSATPSPADSPIQALHGQQAAILVPQAPLGNATNGPFAHQAPGMGAKALMAKKMAKNLNPARVSPTDNLMTPVTAKLNQVKKKHFTKGKPILSPFATPRSENISPPLDESDVDRRSSEDTPEAPTLPTENDNPF